MDLFTLMLMVFCGIIIVVAMLKRLFWLACVAVAILVLQQLGVWEQCLEIAGGFLADGPLRTPAFLLPFLPGQSG